MRIEERSEGTVGGGVEPSVHGGAVRPTVGRRHGQCAAVAADQAGGIAGHDAGHGGQQPVEHLLRVYRLADPRHRRSQCFGQVPLLAGGLHGQLQLGSAGGFQ